MRGVIKKIPKIQDIHAQFDKLKGYGWVRVRVEKME